MGGDSSAKLLTNAYILPSYVVWHARTGSVIEDPGHMARTVYQCRYLVIGHLIPIVATYPWWRLRLLAARDRRLRAVCLEGDLLRNCDEAFRERRWCAVLLVLARPLEDLRRDVFLLDVLLTNVFFDSRSGLRLVLRVGVTDCLLVGDFDFTCGFPILPVLSSLFMGVLVFRDTVFELLLFFAGMICLLT
jgi:hypothetical protein